MDDAIAVVIATRNRPGAVRDAVTDAVGQLGADDEILVVDQSDAAEAAANEALPVPRLVDPGRGLPQARNLGVARTRAPLLLFLDDDVRLHPGCLASHRRRYRDPCVGGVVGGIVEHRLRPNASRVTNRVGRGGRIRTRLDGDRPQRIETLKGCNMSLRRAALDQVGGFDTAYRGTAFLEDADISARLARAGWHLWFEPGAAVDHLSAPTGGVRVGDRVRTEWWRFRNTGYFVGRHRGIGALLPTTATFGAIAVRRALAWRRPEVVPRLLSALAVGWAEARRTRPDW